MREIKTNVYDNFSNDSLLLSLMIMFNCNRSVDEDVSSEKLQKCVEILNKILSNLLTEDQEQFEKFTRVRRSKIEDKVLNLQGALDFLYAVGFTTDPEQPEWLVFDRGSMELPEVHEKITFVKDLLADPQVFPVELDREVKLLSENESTSQQGQVGEDDDLKMTQTELKQLYSNMEKTREVNSMFVSKDYKNKLLSSKIDYKYKFAKLRCVSLSFILCSSLYFVCFSFADSRFPLIVTPLSLTKHCSWLTKSLRMLNPGSYHTLVATFRTTRKSFSSMESTHYRTMPIPIIVYLN